MNTSDLKNFIYVEMKALPAIYICGLVSVIFGWIEWMIMIEHKKLIASQKIDKQNLILLETRLLYDDSVTI